MRQFGRRIMIRLQRGGGIAATLSAVAIALLAVPAPVAAADAEKIPETIRFNRDVRPILSDNCFECHGPDTAIQEADLRLDERSVAVAPDRATEDAVGPAIVPGKPDQSEIIRRVTADDPDERMPRNDDPLTDTQIKILRRWIEQGAGYEKHWAFQPIGHPEPPKVENPDWVRNPIDRFILGKLDEEGIQPSPPADRHTLIRRLYLDLLGLPPEPEAVEAFVNDTRPDAYERLVDRLLENPHYGERWGQHWLDQARYADSHGYTIDSGRTMWPYRDWVIEAFNRDLPFDEFTVQQLAGDLLEDPTRDQLVATGFHRNTLINQEGGTDKEQFRVEATVDRVNTTGAVWLGLTVGCAQCHDHKFDPVAQQEFYELYAFFNDAADANTVSPTLRVPSKAQKERLAELDNKLAEARQALERYEKTQDSSRATWEKQYLRPTDWTPLTPTKTASKAGAQFRRLEDGSLLATGPNGERDRYTISAEAPKRTVRALRLETLTHPSLPQNGPGRAGNGNFVLNHVTVAAGNGEPVPFVRAVADHSQPDYDISKAIDGQIENKSGWAINVRGGEMNVNRTAVFELAEPLQLEKGETLTVRMHFGPNPPRYQIGRFRLAVTDAAQPDLGDDDPVRKLLKIPENKRTKEQKQRLTRAYQRADPQRAKLLRRVEQLEQQKQQVQRSIPSTMVMRNRDEHRTTRLHKRGNFLDKGKVVQPNVPDVLPGLETPNDDRPTRLELARWLVDEENPLTARVRVNRIWMRYFGRGLVETENDFGTQGTPPTHPDLLDWLAGEFMRRGWSMKSLHRLIVNSATYRQASDARPDLQKVDPRNKLLARQSRFRVPAEIVRDLALGASGMLTDEIGGPSVHPPQPDGVYSFTQTKKRWNADTGPDRYRRGMYIFFYRSAAYPMLTTFDAPRFNATCTRRERSNTPLQALTLANDQAFIEMARGFARRLFRETGPDAADADRMRRAFRLALARHPKAGELDRLLGFLNQQRQRFAAEPSAAREFVQPEGNLNDEQAVERAAWAAAARVLMNLDEFITRP